MSRKTAREVAMKLAYEKTFGSDDTYAAVLEKSEIDETPDKADVEFANEVIEGIAKHEAEIDVIISASAKVWTIERMPRVDLSILRIAVFELAFADKVPHKVVINEAVRLARRYGGEDSPRFVNGVLGNVVKQLPK